MNFDTAVSRRSDEAGTTIDAWIAAKAEARVQPTSENHRRALVLEIDVARRLREVQGVASDGSLIPFRHGGLLLAACASGSEVETGDGPSTVIVFRVDATSN